MTDYISPVVYYSDLAIARLLQVKINGTIDNPSAITEVKKAMQQINCGKAPGSGVIPAEGYKASGSVLTIKLQELFFSFWVMLVCHDNSIMHPLYIYTSAKLKHKNAQTQRYIIYV